MEIKGVYLGGPLFSKTPEEGGQIAKIAMGFARKFWCWGLGVYSPPTNCLLMPFANNVMREHIVVFNLQMLQQMDFVFMLPGWKKALEAEAERAHALMLRKPVFYSLHQVERHLERR